MSTSPSPTQPLFAVLRRSLRASGWTARTIAPALGIGDATAKRWLAGKGLSIDQLARLAALAGLTLAALTRAAEAPDETLASELTLAQERALSSDATLSFLFMTILAGAGPRELAEDFDLPARTIEAALTRLERLALIDRLPATSRSAGERVRARIDRSILWRKSPMRTLFEERMKAQFLSMDFAAEEAVYASDIVKLSAKGAATLAEMIEAHRQAVQAMAMRDRDETRLPRKWYALLSAARALDTGQLQQNAD